MLDREVLPSRMRLCGRRGCSAVVTVALLAGIAAYVVDRRATALERQRTIAEAVAADACARLHAVRLRLDMLEVRPVPDVEISPHPSEADIARQKRQLAKLVREHDRLVRATHRLAHRRRPVHVQVTCLDNAVCRDR
jgi:hypothetical protein